jgi:hypothetical protein
MVSVYPSVDPDAQIWGSEPGIKDVKGKHGAIKSLALYIMQSEPNAMATIPAEFCSASYATTESWMKGIFTSFITFILLI